MPFTLAHPAAVVPLVRRPLDGLALVCGAMAPDLPYYVRSTPLQVTAQSWYEPFTNATTTHSLAALLAVTVPMALASYLVLRAARPPLSWLVQGRWGAGDLRMAGAPAEPEDGVVPRGGLRWVWVPVSLVIGALTHLVWDSLTSSDGFLAERVDVLNEVVVGDLTWVRSMQHASTVLGLVVVVVALWRRRRTFVTQDRASRQRLLSLLAGVLAVGVVAGAASVLATVDSSASATTRDLAENVVATALMGGGAAVGLVVILATAIWWLAVLGTRERRSPSTT